MSNFSTLSDSHIERMVEDFVKTGKTFSAYDVCLALRAKNFLANRDRVNPIVHHYMSVNRADYEKVDNLTYIEYRPLVKKCITESVNGPVVKTVGKRPINPNAEGDVSKTIKMHSRAFKNYSETHKISTSERVNIPSKFMKKLGVNAGDTVYVFRNDTGCLVQPFTTVPGAVTLKTDHHNNLRIRLPKALQNQNLDLVYINYSMGKSYLGISK